MPRKPIYPFDGLTADNSFDIPASQRSGKSVAALCHTNGKRLGRSFSYRYVKEDDVFEVTLAAPVAAELRARRRGGGEPSAIIQKALDDMRRALGFAD